LKTPASYAILRHSAVLRKGSAMAEHDHDHDHSELSDIQLRVRALETILTEKGYIDPAVIDQLVESYETKIGPKNGARIVAHAPTAADIRKVLSEPELLMRIMPQYADRFGTLGARVPEPVVDLDTLPIPRGGQPMLFGPAHSFHDAVLWFAGQRVLVAADLCSNGVLPLAIHGSIANWADALSRLIALDPEVVIPGHGPVGSAQTLRDLREYLVQVNAVAEAAVRTGASVEDALSQFDPGPTGGWLEGGRTRQNITKAIEQARSRAGYIPGLGPVTKERVRQTHVS